MTMKLGMRSAINSYFTGRFFKASAVPAEVAYSFAAAKRERTNVCSLLSSPCENLWFSKKKMFQQMNRNEILKNSTDQFYWHIMCHISKMVT